MTPREYCERQLKIKNNRQLDDDTKNKLIMLMVAEDLERVLKPKRSEKR
jgi:hypothetical protein